MAAGYHVAPLSFDLKDPKGVSSIRFKLDSELEPLMGSTTAVAGNLEFDPNKPESTTGKIVVKTESLTMPVPLMSEHLRGEQWLDAAKHPEITFVVKKVEDVEADDQGGFMGAVVGDLTIRGVTREITATATLGHYPGRLGNRVMGAKGDLIVLRSEFEIERSDFGINPGAPEAIVAPTIQVDVAIVGVRPE